MITQQAKDHAQACLDATKEAARHTHMGDAQKAAYMTILAQHPRKGTLMAGVYAAVAVSGVCAYPTIREFLVGVFGP